MTATALGADLFREAVAAGVRAPSLHNSQPWLFRLRPDGIEVRCDRSRSLPATDPTGWGIRVACGAAAFNVQLCLAAAGRSATVRWRPDPADRDLMAMVVAGPPAPPAPWQTRLHAAIGRRHTNRSPFWPQPVPAAERTRLVEVARSHRAWLELVSGPAAVGAVAELARTAHNLLARDPAYASELAAWTRVDDTSPDGVPSRAGGPSPRPQDLLPQRVLSGREGRREYEPQPLVGVLGTAGDLPADQLGAGWALQAVLLTATELGLAVCLLSQPIEVAAVREQLRVALGRFGTPHMVLRIGYSEPGFTTPRRPLSAVILDGLPGGGSGGGPGGLPGGGPGADDGGGVTMGG